MIDTIFYFTDSLSFNDYKTMLYAGEIEYRTIVFAQAQRAIYKGGVRYGGLDTSSDADSTGDSNNGNSNTDTEKIIKIIDKEIEKAISDGNDLAESERERLNKIIDSLNEKIKSRFETMLKDADWVRNKFPEGVVDWDQDWDEELRRYLQTVGYWTKDKSGNTITIWSSLLQKYDQLEANVQKMSQSGTTAEAIQAWLNLNIDEVANMVEAELATSYTESTIVGDVVKVIKWLYSGLTSQSTADWTLNDLTSATSDANNNAIANIHTAIEWLGDKPTSTASLSAMVNDSITGVVGEATDTTAKNTIYAKVNKNSDDIATIVSYATGNATGVDIASKFANNTAGFVTKTTMDSAISGLMAKNEFTRAAIVAKVNDNSSNIVIDAANIDITGLIEHLRAQNFKFGIADHFGFEFGPGNAGNNTTTVLYGGMFDSTGSMDSNPQFQLRYEDTNQYIGPELRITGGGKTSWLRGNAGLIYAIINSGFIYDDSETFVSNAEFGSSRCDAGRYITKLSDDSNYLVWNVYTDSSTTGRLYPKMTLRGINTASFSETSSIVLDTYDGSITASGTVTQSSDMTLKNVVGNTELTVEQIAEAPAIDFTWKADADREDKKTMTGTSAQYWQEVMPTVVSEIDNGKLGLQYGNAAMVSSIIIAREVVALKAEIENLKQQIAELRNNA